jgi:hypothetical protein
MEDLMETRTKRMRKVKANNKRKVNRNKVSFKVPKTIVESQELLKEQKELLNDREEYSIK